MKKRSVDRRGVKKESQSVVKKNTNSHYDSTIGTITITIDTRVLN